jgi:hypothetical protein
MKQHRTRQRHSTNRNHTPPVICLPPPSLPVTPKRTTVGATSALTLPKADEPLALSRQVRRQQRRSHTRTAIEPAAPAPVAVAEPVAPLAAPVPVTSSVPIDADAPLPRNRSLAPTRKGVVAAMIGWLRKPAWKSPRRRETTAISQLQALRDEVAALQISLDRALEGMAA